MVMLANRHMDVDRARDTVRRGHCRRGRVVRACRAMIARQGGDSSIDDDPRRLPQARHRTVVTPSDPVTSVRLAAERLGQAAVDLGAGRERVDDSGPITPSVSSSRRGWARRSAAAIRCCGCTTTTPIGSPGPSMSPGRRSRS
jgi:thymidine phosphorylase